MRLTIRQNPDTDNYTLSTVTFSNNAISEIVTFWANVKHESPQFPLDLTPNITQMTEVYPNWLIPVMSAQSTIRFDVSSDANPGESNLDNLAVVQLKLSYTGPSAEFPGWEYFFSIDETIFDTVYTPDLSAYLSVKTEGNPGINPRVIEFTVNQQEGASVQSANLSYQVLVSFNIGDKSYHAIIDPLIKVTNQSGG